MNRLRDAVDREGGMRGDPLFRRGVELLQGTPPTEASAEARARVWHSLGRARAPAARGLRTLVLRFAVIGGVALVAGTAGAVIAQRWIAPRLEGSAPPVRSTLPPRSSLAPRAEPVKPIAADEIAPGADAVEAPVVKAGPPRAAPRKPAVVAAAPSAAAVARERTEVLDALIALRREHDAVRAGKMLARYLAAHPRGTLREEALVLAIEAADARGDRAAGEQLARTYQGEYSTGRFLSFARSHTGK
jgi:hypothetical protein